MAKPSKKSNQGTKVVKTEKVQADAFVNCFIQLPDGSEHKLKKGFPLYSNKGTKWEDADDNMLIDMIKAHGGMVPLTIRAELRLNKSEGNGETANGMLGKLFAVVPEAA